MPMAHSVASVHSALGLVLAGEGLAILPEGVLQLRPRGIVFRVLDGPDRGMEVMLCWRCDGGTPLLGRVLSAVGEGRDVDRVDRVRA